MADFMFSSLGLGLKMRGEAGNDPYTIYPEITAPNSLVSIGSSTSTDSHESSSSRLSDESESLLDEPKRNGTAPSVAETLDLDNPERAKLLGLIDQFRASGVGEDVELPQLVVIGDQSSGKSSLLQSLTGVPFPISSGLCTRFATQVVVRRSKDPLTRVTILSAPDTSDERKAALKEFNPDLEDLDSDAFAKILAEANGCIVSPTDSESNLKKTHFSEDVLKIELEGPKHSHLSFVDLPGLFHNRTGTQTKEDPIIVRKLIERYIKEDRTIILAVMDGANELSNQEIFEMAKMANPNLDRTVGVITKLDDVPEGNEIPRLKIAKNEKEPLPYGWYCVKNRSTNEIENGVSIEERGRIEERDHVGIPALKAFLGDLLYRHIKEKFPKLREELAKKWKKAQKALSKLGDARETAEQQRRYLRDAATEYQRMVRDALDGRYWEEGDHPSKFRVKIRTGNDNFSNKMRDQGHTFRFLSLDADINSSGSANSSIPPSPGGPIPDLVLSNGDRPSDTADIYLRIKERYNECRGAELPGLVSPTVIELLFRDQTVKWQSISKAYIEGAIKVTLEFNDVILKEICGPLMCTKLRDFLESDIQVSIQRGHGLLQEFLYNERYGTIMTVNPVYTKSLAEARGKRLIAKLKRLGYSADQECNMPFEKLLSIADNRSDASVIDDIHDILNSYYAVSLSRFADDVVKKVTEEIFLSHETSKLNRKPKKGNGLVGIFSPDMVNDMTDAELKAVAGEDTSTSERRGDLTKQAARLREALNLCDQHGF